MYKCPICFASKTKPKKNRVCATERRRGYLATKLTLYNHIEKHHLTNYYNKTTNNFCCPLSYCGFQFTKLERLLDHIFMNHFELFGISEVCSLDYEGNLFYIFAKNHETIT